MEEPVVLSLDRLGIEWQQVGHADTTELYTVNTKTFNFHSRTVHLDIIKVLLPTDAQEKCFKRSIKNFTLKQLQHVSV